MVIHSLWGQFIQMYGYSKQIKIALKYVYYLIKLPDWCIIVNLNGYSTSAACEGHVMNEALLK